MNLWSKLSVNLWSNPKAKFKVSTIAADAKFKVSTIAVVMCEALVKIKASIGVLVLFIVSIDFALV